MLNLSGKIKPASNVLLHDFCYVLLSSCKILTSYIAYSSRPPCKLIMQFFYMICQTSRYRTFHMNQFGKLCWQVLELGIVVHSVVIGLSLGASNNTCTIKGLVAALCFHQMFEGMGLGGCILQVYIPSYYYF